MDIGGGTKYRNDVLLDGTPLTAGNKLGYTPPMDAVTEYTIQQNSVDAEFGHSAGGIAIVTMKSGTNDVHGTAYYYGRDAEPERDQRPRDSASTTTTPTGTPAARSASRSRRTSSSSSPSSRGSRTRRPRPTDLHAADRARAPGRLLAVLQRRRHAARHLRPADLAHSSNGKTTSATPSRATRSRGPLGPPGREDPGQPLGSEQRGRRPDRPQQLQVPRTSQLPLLQLLDARSTGTSTTTGRPSPASAA